MVFSMFFSWLLYSSLMASLAAGTIFLVKLIFRNSLGARWHYTIWVLLVFRLVMPFAPESSLSIHNLMKYLNHAFLAGISKSSQISENSEVFINSISNGISSGYLPEDNFLPVTRGFHFGFLDVLFIVWLAVVLVLIALLSINSIKISKRIKSMQPVTQESIISIFEVCKTRMRISANIKLLKADTNENPALYGITRSCLLLPADIEKVLGADGVQHIIMHELAHYIRKDMIANYVITLMQVLHWFNPLVYWALRQMRHDMEPACDALVLSYLGNDNSNRYALTIIQCVSKFSNANMNSAVVGISAVKARIINRIQMVRDYKPETRPGFLWKIAVFFLVGCIVLTNGREIANGETREVTENIVYEDFSHYFRGYDGSFVLFDTDKNKYYLFNEAKAIERISPCSTFKIIDSLIALETDTIKDEYSQLKWDGTKYPIELWNHDQTLASAMKYSVSWYFEDLNSDMGEKSIQKYVSLLDYGNNDITGGIRDFWFQSSLKISPLEQVEILKKFNSYNMPFSRKNIDTVKGIIKLGENEAGSLYGKTGSGLVNNKDGNGWFVGFIEKKDNIYVFAANIQGDSRANGENARRIAFSILAYKGVYVTQ